jgi:RHS repeat-associated protein
MWELPVGPMPGGQAHVFFELGDHLGSTSVVLDQATGELVERSTFQAYGGAESDYRPSRWAGFREDYRFTGKEEDVEVGLQYFGKRWLNPLLRRWVSFDPLTLHGLGADANGYAYVSGAVLKNVDPLGLADDEANPPTVGVLNDNPAAVSEDGSEMTFAPDIIVGGDPPNGMGEAKPFATSLLEPEVPKQAKPTEPTMGQAAAIGVEDTGIDMLQSMGAYNPYLTAEENLEVQQRHVDALEEARHGPLPGPYELKREEHHEASSWFAAAIAWVMGSRATKRPDPKAPVLKGPIPDQVPANLVEQLTLAEAKSGVASEGVIMRNLNDAPRLDSVWGEGPWVKMENVHRMPNGAGQINVHWFHNERTLQSVEFKFKFRQRDGVGVKKPKPEPRSPKGTRSFP